MDLSVEDQLAIKYFLMFVAAAVVFGAALSTRLSLRAVGAVLVILTAWAVSAIMSAWGAYSLMALDVSVIPVIGISALATIIAAICF